MKKPNCFVTNFDLSLSEKLKADLITQGFTLSKGPYQLFQGKKKGITITVYESGKLTVQGKEKDEFIQFYLEPTILQHFSYSYPEMEIDFRPKIGVDEAGKGDFFGPLCIAGVYADQEGIKKLLKLGIKDSKKIGDAKIKILGKEIQSFLPTSTVILTPKKYNELYLRFQNLNALLAWGHATVIENLCKETATNEVLIDQFANEKVVLSALQKKNLSVQLKQMHRAESDPVVAAASVIARMQFLEGMERLSTKYDLPLPKGASSLVKQSGKAFIQKYGLDLLRDVAKIHFKTYQEIAHA